MHVFRDCTFNPERPLAEQVTFRDAQYIFVEQQPLNALLRTLPGYTWGRVKNDELLEWVILQGPNLSQSELIRLAGNAFPNRVAPTRDRVIEVHRAARLKLGMAPLKPGRPSKA